MKFEGIIVPVITPFGKDFCVDEIAWAAMLEHTMAQGVDAIVIGGTTGENYALTAAERLRQFAYGQEVIADRVPWIAGVNDIRTEDVCAYATAARANGASALLLGVPPYAVPTDAEMAQHVAEVDQAAGLPIMLYNYPGRSGTDFGTEFLRLVGDRPNIMSIKESSGDLERIHLLAREFPGIQLSCGADHQALEFFVWGATSWVCAGANFMAPTCRRLYEVCVVEKDFAKGRRIMEAMMPLMVLLEQGGKFVQCVKHACRLDGLPAGETVRRPLRPLDEELGEKTGAAVRSLRVAIAALDASGS